MYLIWKHSLRCDEQNFSRQKLVGSLRWKCRKIEKGGIIELRNLRRRRRRRRRRTTTRNVLAELPASWMTHSYLCPPLKHEINPPCEESEWERQRENHPFSCFAISLPWQQGLFRSASLSTTLNTMFLGCFFFFKVYYLYWTHHNVVSCFKITY